MAEAARAWNGPQIARLRDGRLHLQDGPIDLVIEAWGGRVAIETAYRAAAERFDGLLASLCAELPALRRQVRASPGMPSPQRQLLEQRSLLTSSRPWAGTCVRLRPDEIDPRGESHTPSRGAQGSRAYRASRGARGDVGREFANPVAQRMHEAVAPYAADTFITPMAAVAGAVAEAVLEAMTQAAQLDKAYVNNGGDIALHLAPGQSFEIGLVDRPDQPSLFAHARIAADQPVRGIATSGWRGRSFSLGIADAVTVLAARAAHADAAATIIANAVDLPEHPGIRRVAACNVQPDSDLGSRLVTRDVAPLSSSEKARALSAGEAKAERLISSDRIIAAALHLQGETRIVGAQSGLLEDHVHD